MRFLRNKKILLVIGIVLVIGGVLFSLFRSRQQKPTPTPTAAGGASYKKLTPGISSEQEVKNELGTPLKETAQGNKTVLEYKSGNVNFNDEFSISSGTLSFVKQIITLEDNVKIPDMEKKYGKYENVLYGPSSVNGYNLYVYPSKGVAYLGQPESGFITEIWYFAPTAFNTFKTNFAAGYGETFQPTNQL